MTDPHDDVADVLGPLDPAAIDSPPEPGSTRFDEIKDTIMTSTNTANPGAAGTSGRASAARPRGRVLLAAAAAIVALAVGAGVLFAPASTPDAAAQVRSAAEGTGDVTDFRVTLAAENLGWLPGGSAMADIDGDNVRMVADGMEFIRVGDTEWDLEDGVVVREGMVPPEDVWAPFGQASSVVLVAALASDQVTEDGAEEVRGTATTRYAIEIDDAARAALAEVPSDHQRWFVVDTSEEAEVDHEGGEVGGIDTDGSGPAPDADGGVEAEVGDGGRLGFLESAERITVWVADDLLHQIRVEQGATEYTFTFYDFGADITVTPPA